MAFFGPEKGMLTFGDATGFFNNIGNTLKSVWNDWTGNTANRENIAYQKEYNAEVFNRADTQYQRTVADLRAAGLSPQLAAGSPVTVAGASQAPQRTVGNESAAIERLVGLVNAIKQTKANVALASAEADNKKADTALKLKQADGFDEYRQMELAVMGSSVSLNNAYTRLAQIDGQTRAAKNIADIQYTMKQTKYLNSLIDLAEKSGVETVAHTDYLNSQIKYLGSQIVTETFRQQNLDAETKYTLQNVANSALSYVIQDYTFKFKTEKGDSPDSSEVSSTQSEENKKEFRRKLILQSVGTVGSVASGIGAGAALMFLRTGGANKVKRKQWDWYRENF